MRFEVVAAFPTIAAGSYTSGFVKDATDPLTSATAATTLLASGGTATKMWQSSEVRVGRLPDLYYTSSDPKSARWSSPGSFAIVLIGEPSVEGEFQVYVHWDVTLSEPTYESEQTGDDGFVTCNVNAFTSKNNEYLSKRKDNDWTPVLPTDFTPALKTGDTVRLLTLRYASVAPKDSAAISGLFGFCTLRAASTRVYPVDDQGGASGQPFFDETYVIVTGERMELTRKAPNAMRGSWYLCPPAPSKLWEGSELKFRRGPLYQKPEPSSEPLTSSLEPSTEKSNPGSSSPISEESTLPLWQYSSTSPPTPSSQVETLLLSLGKQMELLLKSQERSTKSSEDFEIVDSPQ